MSVRPVPRGGEGVGRPPAPPPPKSNYRVPPAHRFYKYKLRLLYFRMQKLTPYSIKLIKKNAGGGGVIAGDFNDLIEPFSPTFPRLQTLKSLNFNTEPNQRESVGLF